MPAANGGADNNISVTFDPSQGGAKTAGSGSAQEAQRAHMQTIDGKPVDEMKKPEIQSGAGEFYPVAGSTTKGGAQGDVPGGRPEGRSQPPAGRRSEHVDAVQYERSTTSRIHADDAGWIPGSGLASNIIILSHYGSL